MVNQTPLFESYGDQMNVETTLTRGNLLIIKKVCFQQKMKINKKIQ